MMTKSTQMISVRSLCSNKELQSTRAGKIFLL